MLEYLKYMMRLLIPVFAVMLLIPSCEEDGKQLNFSYFAFEAIVVDTLPGHHIVCDPEVVLLRFIGRLDDVDQIARNTEVKHDSVYAALNLPEYLKTEGMAIKLNIRRPKDDEMPGCYNFEMPVFLGKPVVFVTGAMKKYTFYRHRNDTD